MSALTSLSSHSAQLLALVATLTLVSAAHRAVLGWTTGPGSRHPADTIRVVVAGRVDAVRRTMTAVAERQPALEVAAVCVSHPGAGRWIDGPPVFRLDAIDAAAEAVAADAVVAVPCQELDPRGLRRLEWRLEASGRQLFVTSGLLDTCASRTTVVGAGSLQLLHVRLSARRGPRRVVKTVVDRVGAALAVVVLLPLLAAVALAIRLDSAGPTIYRQTRVGRHGAPFKMYKFRTMTLGAEQEVRKLERANEADGVLFKLHLDPRVTRVGAVLRRYSLDELPQLVNVLRGHMSLVGPRPALPCEVAEYDCDPWRRLAMNPGITGLWQVSGRSDLSWDEAVRLDLHYVDNWSLRLDLWILARTVIAVLTHRGAY